MQCKLTTTLGFKVDILVWQLGCIQWKSLWHKKTGFCKSKQKLGLENQTQVCFREVSKSHRTGRSSNWHHARRRSELSLDWEKGSGKDWGRKPRGHGCPCEVLDHIFCPLSLGTQREKDFPLYIPGAQGEKVEAVTVFSWAPKSLQMVTVVM